MHFLEVRVVSEKKDFKGMNETQLEMRSSLNSYFKTRKILFGEIELVNVSAGLSLFRAWGAENLLAPLALEDRNLKPEESLGARPNHPMDNPPL
ncbi:hypothetical protein TNCV_2544461 [Trichonephila clavipes]|nr:hypothetical protein TNCV_2544461 [Trichonephila clavipes]